MITDILADKSKS